uniref:Lipocalin n=1 Tax=Rhipicephalus zambeziensis TaxID=60191 RepID=A0A224YLF3_9ACAR
MFTPVAGLLVVFAAYAAYAQDAVAKTPYEDDLSHSNEQRIKNVAAVPDTWIVKKRNVPPTQYSCHSATQVAVEGSTYTYLFSVRDDTTKNFIKWNVPMTTLATTGHQEDNAVKFTFLNKTIYPEAEEQTSKLMTEDVDGGCAVLVTDVPIPGLGDYRVCMVVVTKPKVTEQLSARCDSVYKQECPHYFPEDEPWKPDCE